METSIFTRHLWRHAGRMALAVASLLLLGLAARPAQASYTVVHDFVGPVADGSSPVGALVEDPTTGNYYGTSRYGGKVNKGCIYCMTPGFGVSVIHNFAGSDGLYPTSTLIVVPSPAGGPSTL